MRAWIAVPIVAAFAAGCASTDMPVAELARTQAAIRAASEVHAERIPRAALHVKMARDQLDTAKRYIANGEGDEASAALDRAELDAELAVMISKQEQSRQKTDAIRERIANLRAGR
jgi:hypothetical protein